MKKAQSFILNIAIAACLFSFQSVYAAKTKAVKLALPTLQVGLNYVNSNMELFNCINDVNHVKKLLIKKELNAKLKGNAVIMTDFKKGKKYPSRKNIEAQMADFVKRANALGRGFFQYSGHGTFIKDNSKDELDKQDEVLVPLDVNQKGFITDDNIFANLIRKMNKSVQLTMLIDSCNSGTVADLPFKWNLNGSFSVQKKLSKKVLRNLPRVVMISGSKDDEYAYDGGQIPGVKKGAGAMTAAFLTSLRARNYKVTYKQLLTDMYAFLKKNGFKQTPQLSSTYKIKLTDPVKIGDVSLM